MAAVAERMDALGSSQPHTARAVSDVFFPFSWGEISVFFPFFGFKTPNFSLFLGCLDIFVYFCSTFSNQTGLLTH